MNTYKCKMVKQKEMRDAFLRRCILAVLLLFVVLAVGGCQKNGQGNGTAPTYAPEAAGTQTDAAAMTPTGSAGAGTAPTAMPTDAAVPTGAAEVTSMPTVMPAAQEPAFAVVTPVPQNAVKEIKGKIAPEDFPKVDGSTATIPLSEALYQVATGLGEKEAQAAIVHTKTTNSYKRLYNKEVDLLIVYEPAESIVERMKTEELYIKPIGLDALVFMANAANPVGSLSLSQLVDIYSGKTNNWAQVGGADQKLLAFQRPVGSGSQTLMQKLVMGDVPMTDGDNVFRYSTMSDILEGMLSYLGEDNTLGYSVFYYANNMYFLPELKFMGVNGVLPSTQTIYDGSYPLTNAFYAVIRPDEAEDSTAHVLFDWLTGEEGQQLVLDLGYVPIAMPSGANLSEQKAPVAADVEIAKGYTLNPGEHYVLFTSQNNSEVEYGKVVVYDDKLCQCAVFYNVVMDDYRTRGRFTGRYLPIGQIRQDTSGEQRTYYGIYDLKEGRYSVTPAYVSLYVLDAELGYYAVHKEYTDWNDYQLIDGTGKVLLEKAPVEDWLVMQRSGNVLIARESVYIEETGEWFGMKYSIYDLDVNLKKQIFDRPEAVPPEEMRMEGVEYLCLRGDPDGSSCCLVDADGNILISEEKFLEKYGNGVAMSCQMPFYSVVSEEDYGENACYSIQYNGEVYFVDRNLNLLRRVKEQVVDVYISYYPDFYCYNSYTDGIFTTDYLGYGGERLRLEDGTIADDVLTIWGERDYVMAAFTPEAVKAEEHMANGEVRHYSLPLENSADIPMVSYFGNGYLCVGQNTGRYVEDYYRDAEPEYQPELAVYTLYYMGEAVAEYTGIGTYVNKMDGVMQWVIMSGEYVRVESESLYEEEYYQKEFSYYVLIEDGVVVYKTEQPVHMQNTCDGMMQFELGNYVYVTEYNGKVIIKTLNQQLGTD